MLKLRINLWVSIKKKKEKKPVAHKYELSTTSNHKCQTNNLSKPEFFKDSFL